MVNQWRSTWKKEKKGVRIKREKTPGNKLEFSVGPIMWGKSGKCLRKHSSCRASFLGDGDKQLYSYS